MKKPKKIAVVVDQLLPGGVQKTAVEEVKVLNHLGFKAKLVILMRKGFERKNERILSKIPYEFLSDRFPKPFQKSFKLPIFNFLSTSHLISPILAPFKITDEEFDLLISHGTTTSLTTWSLSKFKYIPYLAVIHDPMLYILDKVYSNTSLKHLFFLLKPISSFLEKKFIASAEICLVDSTVHAQYLRNKYGVSPQILPLGIKPPQIIPIKRGSKILAFGRWSLEKNPELLLKILQRIQKAELIIAGTWTSRHDLEIFKKSAQKKGLKNRITIIPAYSEKQLNHICRQGRVWVHPNFEAFSLSALEAAANGLPIIIPAKSGITEIFKDGIHGFFPKRISVSEYVKKLAPLLEDERLAFRLGSNAAKIASKYTPQTRAIKLSNMIKRIFHSKKLNLLALETGHITGSLISGGDRLLEEMAKKFPASIEISLIVSNLGQEHWKKSGLRVKFHTLSRNKFDKYSGPLGVFLNYLIRSWQSYFIIKKIIKKNNDIVLYSSTGIFPDILPIYLVKLTNPNIRWIARVHHLLMSPIKRPGRFWVNVGSYFLEKISLFMIKRKANSILVLNSKLKKELIRQGFSKDKTIILEGGVDFEAIRGTKVTKIKEFAGVFLGRIHDTKGVFDLVPIWSEVVNRIPDAKLAIIGTGSTRIVSSLKKQIRNAKLHNNILFLGYLSQSRVWESLKKSQLFLFTDHEAGFGLAAAEAMSAGCVVVGWNIGILGTVFKSGYIQIQLNNYSSFSKTVCNLLERSAVYNKLSQEAITEASQFDWRNIGAKFVKILNTGQI